MIGANRHPDRAVGRAEATAVIQALTHGVPPALTELARLGRTLAKRAGDILAYFDRPRTSNGPTEATNGRLKHLRGSALASATSRTTSSSTPRDRRLQNRPTPSIVKSR